MPLQGILQYAACAVGTTAAASTDAELLAQFLQASAAFGDGIANIFLGNGIADADKHDGSPLTW
jgi:hypothetical protein